MSFAEGLSAVSTALSAGSSIANLGLDAYSSAKNYNLQKQNLQWQKDVQQKTWDREDNATQRRVADLNAAGLSPTLAAGNAASSGPIVSTVAPRVDMPKIPDIAAQIMALQKGQADITQTNEQAKLTNLQQEKTKADTITSMEDAALKRTQATNVAVDSAIKSRDLKLATQSGGSMSNPTDLQKYYRDVLGIYDNIKGRLDDKKYKDMKDDLKKNPPPLPPKG